MLARRWRAPIHINVGELRAGTLWMRVFSRAVGPHRLRVLDLTDSLVTHGVLSKGRSNPFLLNVEGRKRAAWEGSTGIRYYSAWMDTDHQPCDGGTRPDSNGVLRLDRPLFVAAKLIVEIYAGEAGVTSACRAAGLSVDTPWDIRYGEQFNVLTKRNRKRLMRLIGSGHVFLVWWGTPCTTFSTARYPPLRQSGGVSLPMPNLSEAKLLQLAEGNALADVTAEGLGVAYLSGAYSIVENPLRSGLWRYKPVMQALHAVKAVHVRTDDCQWGMPWCKPTNLAGTLPGFKSLKRVCCGRNHLCSRTGQRHFILRGRRKSDGKFWTKIAEPYPLDFCAAVARVIHAALSARAPAEVGKGC